ncbi:MAG: phage tail protein [Saprospiraceae bacterium]|nr:phage tail protein [Saprospiraceae bacterium]
MADYYPPVSFHFKVSFLGLSEKEHDIKFQSVSGLDVQLETESIKEGGENRFEHTVPTRRKHPDLVLKRGVIAPEDSAVTEWCRKAFEQQKVEPIALQVVLLNEKHEPLIIWDVAHAWPKSWKFNELNADKGEVFMETIELSYNRFKVRKA